MEALSTASHTEKFSPEELSRRHKSLLTLLVGTQPHPEGLPFIVPTNLQGTVLDISGGCCDAGERALRAFGAGRVNSISLPNPRLDYDAEREHITFQLEAHLRLVPSDSAGLVTTFGHCYNLVGTEASRQIERILVLGGQWLTTVQDRTDISTSLSDWERVWYPLDKEFHPNAAVSVVTKGNTITPKSHEVFSRGLDV